MAIMSTSLQLWQMAPLRGEHTLKSCYKCCCTTLSIGAPTNQGVPWSGVDTRGGNLLSTSFCYAGLLPTLCGAQSCQVICAGSAA